MSNYDTCQRTKLSNKEYVKLQAKLSEWIPWNKICVDLIVTYVIRRKCKKENLHLKSVTMIYSVIWWFEIGKYEDEKAISTANLVETTWLSTYPRPIEIMYDQGKEFISSEFRKSLIETEYGISTKPSTSWNPMFNAMLERIHQVLGNLVQTVNTSTQTYVEKDDSWTLILAAAAFSIFSTTNKKNWYSSGQLIFGHDMIFPRWIGH